jgi:catechol 2,3-dioxygenase-like lactoylglutathione lyase family enzyme
MGSDRVSAVIPFLHVRDVRASIAFYEQLGLEVDDTYEQDGRMVWVSMKSGSAALMLAESPPPIEPSGGRDFFYTADLDALRERLIEAGSEPPEIEDGTPGPTREMSICDPDRHFLTIAEIEGRGHFRQEWDS